MAITRYVRTSADAGGDGTTETDSGGSHAYQSLAALITGEAGDLGGEELTIQLSVGSGSAADTAVADIAGFSNGTIVIRAKAGEESDREWDAANYRLVASPGYAVPMLQFTDLIAITLEPIQIENQAGASNRPIGVACDPTIGTNAQDITIHGGFWRHTGSVTSPDGGGGLWNDGTGATSILARNVIIEGFVHSVRPNDTYSNNASQVLAFDNFTMIDPITAGVQDNGNSDNGNIYCRNNVADGEGTAGCWNVTGSVTINATDYFTSDATSPSSDDTKTFAYTGSTRAITAGSDGYEEGTDLSGDGDNPFSTDMEGTTRTAPWDCGAIEVSVGGPVGIVVTALGDIQG